jgi:hypothetical protein
MQESHQMATGRKFFLVIAWLSRHCFSTLLSLAILVITFLSLLFLDSQFSSALPYYNIYL